MKVTSFYLISKIEEAASSYFSNSMIFSSQKIATERYTNFRKHTSGVSFFIQRRANSDNVQLGSFSVETVQEKEDKVAFQCRINILPSGDNEQFFVLLPIDRDSYADYMNFIDKMKGYWEKSADKYLAQDGDLSLAENNSSSGAYAPDDEYEGLTPEEIEAVTGVRPGSETSASSADEMSPEDILSQFANEGVSPVEESSSELDENDIASLLSGGEESPVTQAEELNENDIASLLGDTSDNATDAEEKQELDENDINALLGDTSNEGPQEQPTENFEAELSEDDISALLGTDSESSDSESGESSDPQNMSMDDISSLLGVQASDDDAHISHEEAPAENEQEAAEMSTDDIDSLMADISEKETTEEAPVETPKEEEVKPEKAPAENSDEPVEMSAEDIWKQISGG